MSRNHFEIRFGNVAKPIINGVKRVRMWERGETAKSKSFTYVHRFFSVIFPESMKGLEFRQLGESRIEFFEPGLVENYLGETIEVKKSIRFSVSLATYEHSGNVKYYNEGHRIEEPIGQYKATFRKISSYHDSKEGALHEMRLSVLSYLLRKERINEEKRLFLDKCGAFFPSPIVLDVPKVMDALHALGACKTGRKNALVALGWNGRRKRQIVSLGNLWKVYSNLNWRKYFLEVIKDIYSIDLA